MCPPFIVELPLPKFGPETPSWYTPSNDSIGHKKIIALKLNCHLECEYIQKEANILMKLRNANEKSNHVSELVWNPPNIAEIGIVPVGYSINFQQTSGVSCWIVHWLILGLEYLHGQGIVHQDIRPTNLILNSFSKVI
jgi:hypothetical protein